MKSIKKRSSEKLSVHVDCENTEASISDDVEGLMCDAIGENDKGKDEGLFGNTDMDTCDEAQPNPSSSMASSRSSILPPFLPAITSSQNKRGKFITKLSLLQTCRRILVTRLHLFTEIDTVEEYFNKFGELEEAFYVHSDHLHYTKSCTVKMGTVSSVSQIMTQGKHKIDDTAVKVDRYQGIKDLQKLYVKGPYKLKMKGLDRNNSVLTLIRDLETAFSDVGRHSSMQLKKDRFGVPNGDAEVRFMTLEDGQTAQELATSRGWPALLYGPG